MLRFHVSGENDPWDTEVRIDGDRIHGSGVGGHDAIRLEARIEEPDGKRKLCGKLTQKGEHQEIGTWQADEEGSDPGGGKRPEESPPAS